MPFCPCCQDINDDSNAYEEDERFTDNAIATHGEQMIKLAKVVFLRTDTIWCAPAGNQLRYINQDAPGPALPCMRFAGRILNKQDETTYGTSQLLEAKVTILQLPRWRVDQDSRWHVFTAHSVQNGKPPE